MRFSYVDNQLCLTFGNGCVIKNVTAFVEYEGKHYDTILIRNRKWEAKLSDGKITATDGRFFIEVAECADGVVVSGKFHIDEPLGAIVNYCFFKGQIEGQAFEKVFINEGTFFNGVKTDDMSSRVGVESLTRNQCKESVDFAVGIGSPCSVVAGSVDYENDFSAVRMCANGSISLITPMFYRPVSCGDTLTSNRFIVAKARDIHAALETYIDAVVAHSGGGRSKQAAAHSGWCSWYYYGPNITESTITENMTELKKRGVDVDIIQIDDGWNVSRGDWEANGKFPSGMKTLADTIKKEGFIPGIWVSPLTADPQSDLFKRNPDMFVKTHDGKEIYGSNTIDFSTEKAQKYLYDLFYKLSREWGYRYIKVDFVIYGISAGKYADRSFNGVKNYKKALEIMRQAITEDTFLLACTSPMSQTVAHADFVRTSMDIFEQWNSLKVVAKQVLLRGFMNKHIRVDPDCIMLRTRENEDAEAFRLCTRTEGEIRSFVSFIAATGGNTILSDKVGLLGQKQIDMFKRLLPVNQRTGKACDLGVRDIPSEIEVAGGDVRTVFLFNWEDYPQTIEHRLEKAMHIYDFWENKALGKKKTLSFSVLPHECKVFHCSDKTAAAYLDRVAPNTVMQEDKKTLTLDGLKTGERVYIRTKKKIKEVVGGKISDGILTAETANVVIRFK